MGFDLAKSCCLGKILQVFGILRIYLVFGKVLNLLWQILYAIGQVLIILSGQILKSSYLITMLSNFEK